MNETPLFENNEFKSELNAIMSKWGISSMMVIGYQKQKDQDSLIGGIRGVLSEVATAFLSTLEQNKDLQKMMELVSNASIKKFEKTRVVKNPKKQEGEA